MKNSLRPILKNMKVQDGNAEILVFIKIQMDPSRRDANINVGKFISKKVKKKLSLRN